MSQSIVPAKCLGCFLRVFQYASKIDVHHAGWHISNIRKLLFGMYRLEFLPGHWVSGVFVVLFVTPGKHWSSTIRAWL